MTKTTSKEIMKFFVGNLIDYDFNISIMHFPPMIKKIRITSIFRPSKIANETKNTAFYQSIVINPKNLEFKVGYQISFNNEFKRDINKDFELFLNLLKRKFGKRVKILYELKDSHSKKTYKHNLNPKL